MSDNGSASSSSAAASSGRGGMRAYNAGLVSGRVIGLLVVVVSMFALAGVSLMIKVWHRFTRRVRRDGAEPLGLDLLERLQHFQPPSVADEAEHWLRRQL